MYFNKQTKLLLDIRKEIPYKTQAPLFFEPAFNSGVKVYMNPAKGILYVEADIMQAGIIIELKYLSGRRVLKKEMAKSPEILTLDKLQSGTYLLDVQWVKRKYSIRIILK